MTRKTKTLTVVVSERHSPFPPVSPWPLIYTVEVDDPARESEVLRHVADIRYTELTGGDPNTEVNSSLEISEIMAGLELHFAFEGDVSTCQDWRN